jgi:hypothetical protein
MRSRLLPAVAGLVGLFSACDNVAGPGPDGAEVGLSFAIASHSPSSTEGMASALSAGDEHGRVLVIERVRMVLAEIELERAGATGSCDEHPELCEDFEAGPVLIDLPVGGGVITPFSTVIPEGSYDELELEIEAPDGSDEVTLAFLEAHPGWPASASMRIQGTFDADDGEGPQPFDIFLDAQPELELEFDPHFVVEPDGPGTLNITIVIDVDSWFRDVDGSLIDPRALSVDSGFASTVHDNIEDSFEAFEDQEKDGVRPEA